MSNSTKESLTGGRKLSPEVLEKRKKINKKILKFVFLPIIILFVIFIFLIPSNKKDEPKATKKQERIEAQFSDWDGSHKNLTNYIKENMNDPKSYEHVETKYWDIKDYIVVQTKYRGKNGFGALVLASIKAEVDTNGNIIKIMEQQ